MVFYKNILKVITALVITLAIQQKAGKAMHQAICLEETYTAYGTNWVNLCYEIESKSPTELNSCYFKATHSYSNFSIIAEADMYGNTIIHLAIKNNHFKFAHYLFNQLSEQQKYFVATRRDLHNETLALSILTKLHRRLEKRESIFFNGTPDIENDNTSAYAFAKKIIPYSNLDTKALIPNPITDRLFKQWYSPRDIYFTYEKLYFPALVKHLENTALANLMGQSPSNLLSTNQDETQAPSGEAALVDDPAEAINSSTVSLITEKFATISISPAALMNQLTLYSSEIAPVVNITMATQPTPKSTNAKINDLKRILRKEPSEKNSKKYNDNSSVLEMPNTQQRLGTPLKLRSEKPLKWSEVVEQPALEITSSSTGNLAKQKINPRAATPQKEVKMPTGTAKNSGFSRPRANSSSKDVTPAQKIKPRAATPQREIMAMPTDTAQNSGSSHSSSKVVIQAQQISTQKYRMSNHRSDLGTIVDDEDDAEKLNPCTSQAKRAASPNPIKATSKPLVVKTTPLEQFIEALNKTTPSEQKKELKKCLEIHSEALIKNGRENLYNALNLGSRYFITLLTKLPDIETKKNLNNPALIDLLLNQEDPSLKEKFNYWLIDSLVEPTKAQRKTALDKGFTSEARTTAKSEAPTITPKKKTIAQIRKAAENETAAQKAIKSGNIQALTELDEILKTLPFTAPIILPNGSKSEIPAPSLPYYGALLYAIEKTESLDSIRYCLSKIEKPNGIFKQHPLVADQTLLIYILDSINAETPEQIILTITESLIAHQTLEINATDSAGITALHLAASRFNSAKLLQLLLKRGANLTARNAEGCTALDFILSKCASLECLHTLVTTQKAMTFQVLDSLVRIAYCNPFILAYLENHPEMLVFWINKTNRNEVIQTLTESGSHQVLSLICKTEPILIAQYLLQPFAIQAEIDNEETSSNALLSVVRELYRDKSQDQLKSFIHKLLELAPLDTWLQSISSDQQTDLMRMLSEISVIDYANSKVKPLKDQDGNIVEFTTHRAKDPEKKCIINSILTTDLASLRRFIALGTDLFATDDSEFNAIPLDYALEKSMEFSSLQKQPELNNSLECVDILISAMGIEQIFDQVDNNFLMFEEYFKKYPLRLCTWAENRGARSLQILTNGGSHQLLKSLSIYKPTFINTIIYSSFTEQTQKGIPYNALLKTLDMIGTDSPQSSTQDEESLEILALYKSFLDTLLEIAPLKTWQQHMSAPQNAYFKTKLAVYPFLQKFVADK
jgi:hypothetical protein